MKRKKLYLLILLSIFLITRLLFLNSGLNVLEPDEQDYQEIVQSAESKFWPLYWQGQPYFEKFPLFIYLGFFLGKLFPFLFKIGPYLNLRLISVVSFFGLSLLFFKYIEERADTKSAFFSTLFLLLNPLLLFYSRQGTFETFFLFFGFLFFYFFEQHKKALDFKKTAFLGILLALAILSKHINILLIILPAYYFLEELLGRKRKSKKWIWFLILGILTEALLLLSIVPVYLYSKELILAQFIGVPRQFFITSPKAFFAILWEFLKIAPFWLSWPIAIGSLIGIGLSFKNLKGNLNYLLILAIGFIYINSYYVTPRSFIFIVPYLMISFSLFLQILEKSKLYRPILFMILSLTFLQAKVAFDSTRHIGLELLLEKAKQVHQKNHLPIFSTFEEDKLSKITSLDIKLLNSEATKSGLVLTDQRKTELMLSLSQPSFKQANQALNWIKENKKPIWEYNDPFPHFPGSRFPNKFYLYQFSD